MNAGKYWWLKVLVLILALLGVLWTMSSLQRGSYFDDPNSPVQVLIGEPVAEKEGNEAKGIPAKVQFEDPGQSPEPVK